MVEQTHYAPISRVDVDKLYVDDFTPDSWHALQERVVRLLEQKQISADQAQALIYALRMLQARAEAVPQDAGDLYLMIAPLLERLPGGYG